MVVFSLVTPQIVHVRAGKLGIPLPIPAESRGNYLVTLSKEQLKEIDRQNEILQTEIQTVLKCIFTWGFTSLHNLRIS